MKGKINSLLAIALTAAAFVVGFQLRGQSGSTDASVASVSLADTALAPLEALAAGPAGFPPFGFLDQDSRPRQLSDWPGKVLVVNFWATWCPPCIEEIPAFIGAQADYAAEGVQFVGIALDDIDSVRAFLEDFDLNYPTAAGDDAAYDLMLKVGNITGGLPFTVLVQRDGEIAVRHAGPLSRVQLDSALHPLVAASSVN